AVTSLLRNVVSPELVPAWTGAMPRPAARLPETSRRGAAAVYFPACINRIFGHSHGSDRELSLPEALVAVSARAGTPLWIPEDVRGACCATVWHSKGYEEGNRYMAREVLSRLWRWTGGGRLPVVVDASSCTLGLTSEVVPYLDAEGRASHEQITVL